MACRAMILVTNCHKEKNHISGREKPESGHAPDLGGTRI